MQIAIIQFSESNSDRDAAMAVLRAGMQPVDFFWGEPARKLADCAGFVLIGCDSPEDTSLIVKDAAFDLVIQYLQQQSELGKPILGIGRGAQILVETGLIPGLPFYQRTIELADNVQIQNDKMTNLGFYEGLVHIRPAVSYQLNAFTNQLKPDVILPMPVAHAKGRFLIPPGLLAEIQAQGLAVFQYCDEQGDISDIFPINPNGSVINIAAVSNRMGNVMAMMPHPERTPLGDLIFHSMREYINQGHVEHLTPLNYQPRPPLK